MKAICLIFTVFLFTNAIGQTSPPPMALPKDSSRIFIDKIIEVTNHESYFIDYCTKKVNNYAAENNWKAEKTKNILASIKFKYYNSTIYNSYAFYSLDQLKLLLDAVTSLNTNPKNNLPMILTNSMMQSNLDLFVESLIAGKYATSK